MRIIFLKKSTDKGVVKVKFRSVLALLNWIMLDTILTQLCIIIHHMTSYD